MDDGVAPEVALNLLRTMLRIRMFDEKEKELNSLGELANYHASFGHETTAAAVCACLRPDDLITTTHRGYPACIAKGVNLAGLMSEIYGKGTGICRGKGGAYHLTDIKSGVLGAYPVVGAGIPIAVGAALAAKRRGTGQVVACFFSDGATSAGAFHEGLNFASVLNVPVVFVCENDGWGDRLKASMKIEDIAIRASSYAIPGLIVDGSDVEAIFKLVNRVIKKTREDNVPVLLEVKNHMPHETPRRNPKAQEESERFWREHGDPVEAYTVKLIKKRVITEKELSELKEAIKSEIEKAVEFARGSPGLERNEALTNIYG